MNNLKKIYIMGTMGSGKTTLAKKLSRKLRIKHYNLDDIYWVNKFTKKRGKKVRARMLNRLARKKSWIIEGVHHDWTDEAHKNADLIIWLDGSPKGVVWNLLKRWIKGILFWNERKDYREQFKSMKYGINYKKDSKKFIGHSRISKKFAKKKIVLHSRKGVNEFVKNL